MLLFTQIKLTTSKILKLFKTVLYNFDTSKLMFFIRDKKPNQTKTKNL